VVKENERLATGLHIPCLATRILLYKPTEP
jgi:hypothetical protein